MLMFLALTCIQDFANTLTPIIIKLTVYAIHSAQGQLTLCKLILLVSNAIILVQPALKVIPVIHA